MHESDGSSRYASILKAFSLRLFLFVTPARFPVRQRRSGGLEVIADGVSNLRILRCNVVLFGNVCLLIVKSDRGIFTPGANSFPATLIKCRLFEAAFVKLPVQKFMGLLVSGTRQSRNKADAV